MHHWSSRRKVTQNGCGVAVRTISSLATSTLGSSWTPRRRVETSDSSWTSTIMKLDDWWVAVRVKVNRGSYFGCKDRVVEVPEDTQFCHTTWCLSSPHSCNLDTVKMKKWRCPMIYLGTAVDFILQLFWGTVKYGQCPLLEPLMKTHTESDTLCPSSSRVPPPPLYVLSLGRLSIDDVLALASSLLGPRMALFCLSRSTAALLLTNCALLFTQLSMIIECTCGHLGDRRIDGRRTVPLPIAWLRVRVRAQRESKGEERSKARLCHQQSRSIDTEAIGMRNKLAV